MRAIPIMLSALLLTVPIGQPYTASQIAFISLSQCPVGFAENAALDGYMLRGTIAAHANVGTSGGSDAHTPTGTVAAPTFTGSQVTTSAITAGTPAGSNTAPTLTMNSYTPSGTNATSTVTPTGTIAWPVGVPAFTGSAGTVPAQVFTGSQVTTSATSGGTPSGTNSAPTLTMNSYTPAGTNATSAVTPTGTIAWPAGVPAFTGTGGTVPAQVFTGSSVSTSAVSAGTPAGTNGATATSGNCAATNLAIGTGATTACKATAPNLTVPAEVFTGSALSTHTHTDTAAGTNATAAFTPAGTNAWPAGVPAFTGSSSTVGAQTFTGTGAVLTGTVAAPIFTGGLPSTHTHTDTAAGTNGTAAFTPAGTVAWPVGVPTLSGSSSTVGAQTFTGSAATLTGTNTAPTFTGSALSTHSHTLTGTGTNSVPAFTGSSADYKPAYLNVIFCSNTGGGDDFAQWERMLLPVALAFGCCLAWRKGLV